MSQVRKLWRGLAVLVVTCWALLALEWSRHGVDSAEERDLLASHVRRFWGRLLKVFNIEVTILGSVPFEDTQPRLIVSNHQSVLDIAILGSLVGGPVLSRGDIAGWPLLGAAAKAGGTIFVDREDRQSGARAIRAMRAAFRVGISMAVFPEGATHRGDDVQPFKAGAFVASRGLPVTVIPVGFVYEPGSEYVGISFVRHAARLASRSRTRAVLALGLPIDGELSVADLADRCAEEVQALVHKARSEADSLGMARFAVAPCGAEAVE
jgi:1-acyl-sn-glycerol-3-phosphate acyltransferase